MLPEAGGLEVRKLLKQIYEGMTLETRGYAMMIAARRQHTEKHQDKDTDKGRHRKETSEACKRTLELETRLPHSHLH